jgi:hypothetical protein
MTSIARAGVSFHSKPVCLAMLLACLSVFSNSIAAQPKIDDIYTEVNPGNPGINGTLIVAIRAQLSGGRPPYKVEGQRSINGGAYQSLFRGTTSLQPGKLYGLAGYGGDTPRPKIPTIWHLHVCVTDRNGAGVKVCADKDLVLPGGLADVRWKWQSGFSAKDNKARIDSTLVFFVKNKANGDEGQFDSGGGGSIRNVVMSNSGFEFDRIGLPADTDGRTTQHWTGTFQDIQKTKVRGSFTGAWEKWATTHGETLAFTAQKQ